MKRNDASISDVLKKRKGMVQVYWSMRSAEKCFHIGFTNVFMVKSEVGGTGGYGLALIQYHAIMAVSSKFANMV